jgi:ketosteroid isomerase-like protein
MKKLDTNEIAKEVKSVSDSLTRYSEKAQLELFFNGYDNSLAFSHFSSEGKMRNYEELKKICAEYYTELKEQKVTTLLEKIDVIDENLAIVGWTGNIIAQLKNGDSIKMNNYAISNIFRKIDGQWKIIHSHESSLPPIIIEKNKGNNH